MREPLNNLISKVGPGYCAYASFSSLALHKPQTAAGLITPN